MGGVRHRAGDRRACGGESLGEARPPTVTGENGGSATLGTTIVLPSDASGIYNIAAVSSSSAGGTASVTVTASGEENLPTTGGDAGTIGLWAGAGLLVIAGGAVAVAASVRRSRNQA